MPKVTKKPEKKATTISFDGDVKDAVDALAADLREKPNALIHRFVIEGLQRSGVWPPKKKAGA